MNVVQFNGKTYTYARQLGSKKKGQRIRKDRIRILSEDGIQCDRILIGFIAVKNFTDDNGIKSQMELTIAAGNARKGVNVEFLLQVEERLPAALDKWVQSQNEINSVVS